MLHSLNLTIIGLLDLNLAVISVLIKYGRILREVETSCIPYGLWVVELSLYSK